MIKTDILIIGAGPVGLFTVFEAGLLKMKCHLIDTLPKAGGQCSELYPKKPIYDIPAYPEILADELTNKLLEQSKQFEPGFTFRERAETLKKSSDGLFTVVTDKGTVHQAPVLVIAGGLGSFEPRKPTLSNLEKYEGNGVRYSIQDPEVYRGKKVVIAGDGDSALDWTIILADIASEVTLIHRSNEFRGALSSVEKVQSLKDKKRIKVITSSQVEKLEGESRLESISIKTSGEKSQKILVDYFIPLFGLLPKLGPISEWGLEIEKNAIKVNNSLDYQTNIKGVFAVGDVNTYPGKLKLILCGFHEATVMCQYAYRIINPEKKFLLKYTTVTGVSGFDGTTKSTPKTLVKKIL